MSGIFGGGRPAPTQAQKDAEAAQAQCRGTCDCTRASEMQGAQSRRRLAPHWWHEVVVFTRSPRGSRLAEFKD